VPWIESTAALAVKDLPEMGMTICPSARHLDDRYPVETEGVMCVPGLPPLAREIALADWIRSKAVERGASTVFVSEPQYRELAQTFGEPHPMAVDGKIGQEYCYVAYVVPVSV
jgi:hypothetical protein